MVQSTADMMLLIAVTASLMLSSTYVVHGRSLGNDNGMNEHGAASGGDASPSKTETTMEVKFRMNGHDVTLQLTENPNVPSDTPISVIENGQIQRWNDADGQKVTAYINRDKLHCIVVMQSANGQKECMGTFHSGDEQYRMMPAEMMTAMTGEVDSVVSVNGMMHAVMKINRTSGDDAADAVDEPVAPPTVDKSRKTRHVRQTDQSTASKQNYVVQYAAVVDYAIFKRWYDASNATTASLKRQEAISNIRAYYAHVVNGIDLRYSTISEPDFSIRVRFVNISIAVTPDASLFTEGTNIKLTYDGEAYTHASKALDALGNYIQNNSMFAGADHVALFSGNFLYRTLDAKGPITFAGLAYINATCGSRFRVSISHEFGQYSVTESATHELGHNLGSGQHDGENNNCNSRDQFIMASSPTQLTSANFDNPFRFSQCSIEQFRSWLVTRRRANCLLIGDSSETDITDTIPNPGQTFNVHQQCQQLYGQQSFYCAGAAADQICSQMRCWEPDRQNCVSATEQRAQDGTTCGNKRWCQLGRCVSDPAAPSAKDTCVYGDYRGLLDSNAAKLTCLQIGATHPELCYETYISSQCCKTCAALFKGGFVGCEYGDPDPAFCSMYNERALCYDDQYRSRCCATCRSKADAVQANSDNGCIYGDNVYGSQVSICSGRGWQCYRDGQRCCQTCSGLFTGVAGCEYGDQVTWCQNYDLVDWCKDDGFAKSCCASCAPFRAVPTVASTASPSSSSSTSTTAITSTTARATTPTSTTVPTTTKTTTTSTPSTASLSSSTSTTAPTTTTTTTTRTTSTTPTSTAVPTTTKTTATVATTTPTTTTTSTPSSTRLSSSTTTASAWPLADKQSWSYCSTLNAGQCFTAAADCCGTCQKLLTGVAGCEYGDTVPWCGNYVQGPAECQRPEVAIYCCQTCAIYQKYKCVDSGAQCSTLFPGQCYDESTRTSCCATCSRYRASISNSCCPYGDKYDWCKTGNYCATNARDCCASCS